MRGGGNLHGCKPALMVNNLQQAYANETFYNCEVSQSTTNQKSTKSVNTLFPVCLHQKDLTSRKTYLSRDEARDLKLDLMIKQINLPPM